MTSGPAPTEILPASQVTELINGLVKALRAYPHVPAEQSHLPARQRQPADRVPADLGGARRAGPHGRPRPTSCWEEQVVYHQLNKTESIAWGLFKDGMRSLTIRRGAEAEELPRFLETINRARFLPADAGDDLLTLLWEQEFELIQYQFIEFFGEGGGGLPEQTGSYPAAAGATRRPPRERRARGRRGGAAAPEGRGRPRGVRLHALLPRRARDQSCRRGGGGRIHAATSARRRSTCCSTCSSCRPRPRIRDGDPRHPRVAVPQLPQRARLPDRGDDPPRIPAAGAAGARALPPEHAAAARRLRGQAERAGDREPAAPVDRRGARRSRARPRSAEVLRELRATALEPLLTWIPSLASPALAKLLEEVADRLAEAHPAEVLRILRSPESEALAPVVVALRPAAAHPDRARPRLRRSRIPTRPSGWPRFRRSRSSAPPPRSASWTRRSRTRTARSAWRPSASWAAAATRARSGASRAVGPRARSVAGMDLTEKMAFFEAYGAIAGAAGAQAAERAAAPARPAADEGASETRACAAIALGQDPDARSARAAPAGRGGQGPRGAQRREPGPAGGRDVTMPAEQARRTPRPTGGSARAAGRCCSRSTPRSGASSCIRSRTPRSRRRSTISMPARARWSALEADLEIRLAGDFIFVNATRLRLELDNYASFSHILDHAAGLRDRRPAGSRRLPTGASGRSS